MIQEKRGLVLLIALGLRMRLFAMSRIRTEINRDVRMMRAAPGEIVGDHVVRARMKEHLHAARAKRSQITRDENVVRDVAREPLQLFPRVTGIERSLVEVGPEVTS